MSKTLYYLALFFGFYCYLVKNDLIVFYHNCLIFVWNKDVFTYSFDYVYENSVTCDLLF
jgi:hypothetical protein